MSETKKIGEPDIDLLYKLMKDVERRTIVKMQYIGRIIRREMKRWLIDADELEKRIEKLEEGE